MKKLLLTLLALLIAVAPLTACSKQPTGNQDPPIICVVTFQAEGKNDVVKEIEYGKALTDIPALSNIAGYTCTWSVTDFSCVIEDMLVTEIKTANQYTITYDLEEIEGVIISKTSQSVVFNSSFDLEIPTRPAYVFNGWKDQNGTIFSDDGVYDIADDVVLTAIWADDQNWSDDRV